MAKRRAKKDLKKQLGTKAHINNLEQRTRELENKVRILENKTQHRCVCGKEKKDKENVCPECLKKFEEAKKEIESETIEE
jgi:hypothetical protein